VLLGLCFGQINEPVPPALLHYADDRRSRYLHHFVCADDITYEEQPGVRENAAWRTHIQRVVLEDLSRRGIDYTVLTGTLEQSAAKVMRCCPHLDSRMCSDVLRRNPEINQVSLERKHMRIRLAQFA